MQQIKEVLDRLEGIIDWAKANQSPAGYFAALYYGMTKAVKDGIDNGQFENGARMEQMDVNFAQRYFDAFDGWRAGTPITKSWQVAFEAVSNDKMTVLQHLLLGMNAHINLDLGIATAQTRPRDAIYGLHTDFNRINDIIAALTGGMQDKLADIFLPFRWLDYFLKTEEEGWINFSIKVARGFAWKSATVLAFAPDLQAEKKIISELDAGVSALAQRVSNPGFWMSRALWLMRKWEKGTVSEKIDILVNG